MSDLEEIMPVNLCDKKGLELEKSIKSVLKESIDEMFPQLWSPLHNSVNELAYKGIQEIIPEIEFNLDVMDGELLLFADLIPSSCSDKFLFRRPFKDVIKNTLEYVDEPEALKAVASALVELANEISTT